MTSKQYHRGLRKSIAVNKKKGYSSRQIQQAYEKKGHDEDHVRAALLEHQSRSYLKDALLLSMLFCAITLGLFSLDWSSHSTPTGFAITEQLKGGCCESLCAQSTEAECSGTFHPGQLCSELSQCRIGCCIDSEGYCHNSYLQGNCHTGNGTFEAQRCQDVTYCALASDKPIIKNRIPQEFEVLPELSQPTVIKGSFFTVRFRVFDQDEIVGVQAAIKNNQQILSTIHLYDDGFHDDGSKDDGIYANVIDSLLLPDQEEFSTQIILTRKDGSKEFVEGESDFTVVDNAACVPIKTRSDALRSVVIAPKGYTVAQQAEFQRDVELFAEHIGSLPSADADGISFYRYDRPVDELTAIDVRDQVALTCDFYSRSSDVTLVIDAEFNSCTFQQGALRVSSQFLLQQSILSESTSQLFENFCNHIVTLDDLLDQISDSLSLVSFEFDINNTIVSAVVDNQSNQTSSSLNLSYRIFSSSYPQNYTLVMNNVDFLKSQATSNETITQTLNLAPDAYSFHLVSGRGFRQQVSQELNITII